MTAAVRGYFAEQDFIEVETACLQVSPGNEAHLHALRAELRAPDGTPRPLYLHTSPEFACKKLLAAGEERLFTLARVFRNRERGPLHHPEFTMLEWYRTLKPHAVLFDDCMDLLAIAARITGVSHLRYRDRVCDPFAVPELLSVADAFSRYAGIDLMATLTPEPQREVLASAARARGIRIADDDNWSDIFSRVLVERVEPHLGQGRATFLIDYPACEAALARPHGFDPRLSQRFELYVCGVELANGFDELTDPDEQRRRFKLEMAEKQRVYGETYPIDEDFLAALPHMPPTSGIALGFDRLVMLATGAPRIDDVIWTPVVEAGA